MIHIGNCDKCPREGVRIVFGWTTRDGRHCQWCNQARLARKKKDGQKRVSASYTKGTPCFECGSTGKKLERSHLVIKGAHKDLEHNPENIVPHCRDCHMKWENCPDLETRMSMQTYKKKRDFIIKHRKPADYL